MKKMIVFFVLAASMGSCTMYAQDTLWQKPAPLGNYFYNHWLDTTQRYNIYSTRSSFSHAVAKQFVTNNDTLQVYGIAAMMAYYVSLGFTPNDYFPDIMSYIEYHFPEDPTFDNCQEYLMLYQYQGGSTLSMQQLGDSLPVHMLHTPISYYFMSNTPPISYMDTIPKPVYERYFSSPQTVHDTFFVGFTITDGGFSKVDSIWHEVRPSFSCLALDHRSTGLGYNETVLTYEQLEIDSPHEWRFINNLYRSYFLFPILTPPDTTVNPIDTTVNPIDTVVNPSDTLVVLPGDTLVIGGDTLVNTGDTVIVIPGEPVIIGGDTLVVNPGDSIIVIPGGDPGVGLQPNDLIYRYTNVAPNPARNSVRITSSFGISRIEAYDLRGRRIYESPQLSTFSFPLSTIDWPRGTYLLRITTPAGPTTKKLLIQ